MKKGGGSESTIIIGPSKAVLVYALHSLEYVLGLARFRVFVPKLLLLYMGDSRFCAPILLIFKISTQSLYSSSNIKFDKNRFYHVPKITVFQFDPYARYQSRSSNMSYF